jgi:hypothetical protein
MDLLAGATILGLSSFLALAVTRGVLMVLFYLTFDKMPARPASR